MIPQNKLLKQLNSNLFEKFIQIFSLYINNNMRRAAQLDVLDQVNPLTNIRAELANLQFNFIV